MTTDLNNSRLLSNRYHLVEMVGRGAMGKVYRAEDTLLGGVIVAIKFLSHMLLNKKMRERFEREATICALLGEKSIHIVRVRDYGVDPDEVPFYVMEFLQGDSLSDIIKVQPFSVPRFIKVIRQICLGLEVAHHGIFFKGELCPIIHRDIKPSNILVVQDPTLGELVKILDFGIAKLIQTTDAQTHSFMGTLAYCSPEQMEGKELDNRSDIYSLGVMMYEMLTGAMPLMPDNPNFGGWYQVHHYIEPRPFNPELNIPLPVQDLVRKCLAKSPSDRPQTVDEILPILESLEPKTPVNVVPVVEVSKQPQGDGTDINRLSLEEICYRVSWPEDKPRQKIVFPRLIRSSQGVFVSLWAMLEHQDILNRMSSTRYNQFLFLTMPHPMLLWITVLHNLEYGPRWLPCYLDLKSPKGQRVVRLLGESGVYQILFFAVNNPERCRNVMASTIAPHQCQMLQDWANLSSSLKVGDPNTSKNALRQEFEKLKPKILMKLEAVQTNQPVDLSG
jgi:eukaryotic-like serine/threonine-protein kinase